MKIGRWIGMGIFLSIVGIGIIAVACTQVDFDQEIKRIFNEPTLEEKNIQFEEVNVIQYHGSADTIKICSTENGNSFQYYEGKYITYDIEYDEESKTLSIQENYKSHIGFSWKDTNILSISSSLNLVEIEMSAGNVILEDLNVDRLDTDVSCGNLVIKNTHANTATLSSNAGNMNIKSSAFEQLDMHINTGNLTFLGDVLALGKIKVDVGNLTLQLKHKENFYSVNGKGEGSSIIEYTVSVGNSSITFEKE